MLPHREVTSILASIMSSSRFFYDSQTLKKVSGVSKLGRDITKGLKSGSVKLLIPATRSHPGSFFRSLWTLDKI